MVGEKAEMQQQLGSISQQLQSQATAKETLQTKLEQLYSTLKEQTND